MMPANSTKSARQMRLGFTLVELLVSVGLIVVVMVSLSKIFSISSEVTLRTAANSEVVEADADVRQTLSESLSKMAPNLLIIECPTPTAARRETEQSKERFLRLNHHRIVFMVNGERGEFQSFTDPTRGDPINNPHAKKAESSQALVYIGPGVPLTKKESPPLPQPLNDSSRRSLALPASNWVLQYRPILLLPERDANADVRFNPPSVDMLVTTGGMLNAGPLYADYRDGKCDAMVSGQYYSADAQTIANYLLGVPFDQPHPIIEALWEPSRAPQTISLDRENSWDYYTRAGANFVPHLSDFRIEWTDGRPVDPIGPDGLANTGDEILETRWFGLRPDPNFDVSNNVLDNLEATNIPYKAFRRRDVTLNTTQEELDAFAKIEWSPTGDASDVNAAYRAVWRTDTWEYRPKALRFSYRIYDEGNHLKQSTLVDFDGDGIDDPDNDANYGRTFVRYGREFSFVTPIP